MPFRIKQQGSFPSVTYCPIFPASMQLAGSYHDKHEQNEDRGHHFGESSIVLPLQLKTHEELESKKQQDERGAPHGPEGGVFVDAFNVHSYEHDHAEVGIESVGDEERRKHRPPTHVQVLFALGHRQHGKHGERHHRHGHLEHCHSQPFHQFFQAAVHAPSTSTIVQGESMLEACDCQGDGKWAHMCSLYIILKNTSKLLQFLPFFMIVVVAAVPCSIGSPLFIQGLVTCQAEA